jgi:pimeloyl-ACP methyl ester carboxylesterase
MMWSVGTEVDVSYATSRDARLAFRVRAGGPHWIVWAATWVSNQDLENLDSQVRGPFERLLSFATRVSYDARGTGLSDPVSLADLPTLECWADDLHAVITAAAPERVVLLGEGMGGPVAALYAATHPERTRALILVDSFATIARSEDYDAGVTPEEYELFVGWVEKVWGTGRFLQGMMPDVPVDNELLRELLVLNASRCLPPSWAPSSVSSTRPMYERSCRASVPRPLSCTRSRTPSFPSSTAGISLNTSSMPG